MDAPPKTAAVTAAGPKPMAPGDAVGRCPPAVPDFELVRCIGRGSYGDVWLARNVLGQCRAVKFVYRSRFADSRPFEREFEGIQRFEPISRSHPSQLHILHVGKNDVADCFYYVMELADDGEMQNEKCKAKREKQPDLSTSAASGNPSFVLPLAICTSHFALSPSDYRPRTLRSDLQHHGRLPPAECIQIGLSLATALQHLHEQGLVHRDIKPSNVLFVNGVPKLGDIGLVTDAGDTQSIVGTEGYLPPEGPGTPQADLYSLGKVLYEISTGMDRRELPLLPGELRQWSESGLILELNEIVLKACDQDRTRRYASAEELRADLELLDRGKSVRRARARAWWARLAGKAALAFVALVILFGTALGRLAHKPRSGSGDGPPSTNDLANALCAKALLALRGDNYAAFAEAYTNLHRASALDPNFARPYVGLYELRLREVVPALGPVSSEEFHSIARKLAELAPDLGVTHCAQSMVNYFDWNFPAALEHARQSVKADPDYEVGRLCFNFILTHWGRPIEGRKQAEIARKLAPSKATVYRSLAHTYYMQRDYTNAIALYRQAIAWQSRHTVAHYCIGRAYLALGDYFEAISYFEQKAILDGRNEAEAKSSHDALRRAFREGDAHGYWQEEWKRTEMNLDGEFYRKAVVQIHLGDTNAAFAWLSKSYESREHFPGSYVRPLSNLLFDEYWDGVRDDPRFQELLDKIGFTKVMRPK